MAKTRTKKRPTVKPLDARLRNLEPTQRAYVLAAMAARLAEYASTIDVTVGETTLPGLTAQALSAIDEVISIDEVDALDDLVAELILKHGWR